MTFASPSADNTFKGQLKAVQWNNRLKSNALMLCFLFCIFFFVTLLVAALLTVVGIFEPKEIVNIIHDPKFQLRYARLFLKFLFFILGGVLFFIYRDIKNVHLSFGATPLQLKQDDPFYRTLENTCISRGLPVPELYMIAERCLPGRYVTAVVLQGATKRAKMMLTPASYNLPKHLQEALIAQAVQRIHTKDTFFFTLFCFLGHFPFHVLRSVNPVARVIFKPFLAVTDLLMKPLRQWILTMRFAKIDAGSLELTKEKGHMKELLDMLAPLKEIEKYYYDPFLPLFIVRADNKYRIDTFRKS